MTKNKRRKARGSSRAGRPKKTDVARNASGRIIQKVGPNERVMEIKRALIGAPEKGKKTVDLSAADDPMDLAYARGWLTKRQVEVGRAYAAYYRASHPTRAQIAPHEAPNLGVREDRPWSAIPDAEITALFDGMMDATSKRSRSEESQIHARTMYVRMSSALTPREQLQVFNCFCLASWPQWVILQCAGKPVEGQWEVRKAELFLGLDVLDALLTRRKKPEIVEMKLSAICA